MPHGAAWLKIRCFAGAVAVVVSGLVCGKLSPAQNVSSRWEIRQLGIDANEGIDLADFNRDGLIDVVAGRNWYAAPDFVARPVRLIDDWNGYVESNGDHALDVDGDGWVDVVAGSFLPTQVHWYQNPGAAGLQQGRLWPKRLLVDTGHSQNEAQLLVDVLGEDRPQWIVNSWNKGSPLRLWRFEKRQAADAADPVTLSPVEISPRGNGHGLGVGDLNGDGRLDILTGQGWFEHPDSPTARGGWRYRADWDMHASVPMIVHDVDDDGRSDILVGNAHDFGLYWWRQLPPQADGTTSWEKSMIDDRFSQPHCLHLADLDGDGSAELITGKRVRAHNGNDPGADMPPCLYAYRWQPAENRFMRSVIEEGHVGTGLQIRSGDLNGDGRTDLAVAGKSGTYVLLNLPRISRDQ